MTPHTNTTHRAVAVITLTVLALALGDALIKQNTQASSIWQVFTLRSGLALPVLLLLTLIFARSGLHWPRHPGWVALRSTFMVAMWLIYYAALTHIPLSVAAAGYYTAPLFITLLAALTMGDRISARQWLAVAIGFAGIVLIIKPASSGFSAYALLPVLSAILYAAAMILTRARCRDEHPMMLALSLNATFILAGVLGFALMPLTPDLPASFRPDWTAMDADAWRVMAILGATILFASVGTAYAYQNGPPALIGTFDFTYVGFSALWGWLIFQERPDMLSALGIALIVAAGLMALRR